MLEEEDVYLKKEKKKMMAMQCKSTPCFIVLAYTHK
jgi:hypothetical protein